MLLMGCRLYSLPSSSSHHQWLDNGKTLISVLLMWLKLFILHTQRKCKLWSGRTVQTDWVVLEFSCSTFTATTRYVATASHGCPLSEYKRPFSPDFSQRLDLFIDWFPENTQEVTLTKSSSGLGFSFLMCELDPPMRDFGTLVRIKKLFPGQPAQQSGRIQEGDVLLAINGHSLKKLTYPVRPHLKSHKNGFTCATDLYIWTRHLTMWLGICTFILQELMNDSIIHVCSVWICSMLPRQRVANVPTLAFSEKRQSSCTVMWAQAPHQARYIKLSCHPHGLLPSVGRGHLVEL